MAQRRTPVKRTPGGREVAAVRRLRLHLRAERHVSGGSPGTAATATATLRGPSGNTESDNRYWAQQALYGKQLRIRIEAD